MLSTADARRAILEAMPRFAAEDVPLAEAAGRVLRQRVTAERDQPPFDRVTMDGIAIAFDALGRTRRFAVQETCHAGDPATALGDDSRCVEVMTGAPLPAGSDCVVPVERLTVQDGVAEIEADYEARRRQFIHARGSDYRRDDELLSPGALLSPLDVAILASAGLARVIVAKRPAISVISTGNELVPPGLSIEPHQVRLSNGPALVAMLHGQGFTDCRHEHLADEPAQLRERLARHLETADVLVLSGGVSMGKADFVPGILQELGVEVILHKIRQRPGLPMWFGKAPGGRPVFALPGNPVSTLVCCRQYVLPALHHAGGREPREPEWATLAEDVDFEPDLTLFLPVRLSSGPEGELRAVPCPTNTSGDFRALHGTDGYVELARTDRRFPAGSPVPLHRWNAP